MSQKEDSICYQMRIHTRQIHDISDKLVNLKLAFALNNNEVWCDGLLVFYEVFKFLEENVPENILPREYYRAEAFEKDLNFYKGEDWMKTYKPRPEVQKYLAHLRKIQEEDPLLLIAYVYHLYMGILSGGQILQKKRRIAKKFRNFSFFQKPEEPQYNDSDTTFNDENIEPGYHVTTIKNKSIVQLKNNMKKRIDDFVKDYKDEELSQKLIEESKVVFQLNNEIIKTVEGVTSQNLKMLLYENFERSTQDLIRGKRLDSGFMIDEF